MSPGVIVAVGDIPCEAAIEGNASAPTNAINTAATASKVVVARPLSVVSSLRLDSDIKLLCSSSRQSLLTKVLF